MSGLLSDYYIYMLHPFDAAGETVIYSSQTLLIVKNNCNYIWKKQDTPQNKKNGTATNKTHHHRSLLKAYYIGSEVETQLHSHNANAFHQKVS